MNHSAALNLPSTASKADEPALDPTDSLDVLSAKASDDDKSVAENTVVVAKASSLKPAIHRVIGSAGGLAKDAAAATREAADHAKRLGTRAVASAETYVGQKPKRSIAIAAVLGAATATLILTKRSRRSVVRSA